MTWRVMVHPQARKDEPSLKTTLNDFTVSLCHALSSSETRIELSVLERQLKEAKKNRSNSKIKLTAFCLEPKSFVLSIVLERCITANKSCNVLYVQDYLDCIEN